MKNKPLPVGWVLTHHHRKLSANRCPKLRRITPSLAGCASTRSGGGTGWG